MQKTNPTILRFLIKTDNPFGDVFDRFHPNGRIVLNSRVWRGKAPRTCAVTGMASHQQKRTESKPHLFDVEVTWRPEEYISYTGNTRYRCWSVMLVDVAKDGTLLDGHGAPLPDGMDPVYLPYEVFDEVDYNTLDFGDFQGEEDAEAVRSLDYEDAIKQFEMAGMFSVSIETKFTAPRLRRSGVKIILTNQPSGVRTDGFGTRIVNVSMSTPHLQRAIGENVRDIIQGVLEGRYSLRNISNGEMCLLELDDLVVDCTPNEDNRPSRFNCTYEYVPDGFLADTASWIKANYNVDVSVVVGRKSGLLLRRSQLNH